MASEFDRLPEELIICILEKILDARSLFMCYSVCKQFATLVRQIRFVSLRLPSAIGSSFRAVPVWPPGIINFLRKLGRVESATIHFSLPDPPKYPMGFEPFYKWKADSSGSIFLFYENISVVDSTTICDDDEGEYRTEFPLFEENSALFDWLKDQLSDSRMRVLYVEELIPLFPKVKSLEAVDSMGRGRFVLDEQGVSKVKENTSHRRRFWIRRWSASEVKLSFSGRVMKEVTLITVGENEDYNKFTEENWFEETEYREVVATMMKKYRCFPFEAKMIDRTFADAAMFEMGHEQSNYTILLGSAGYSLRRDRRYRMKWQGQRKLIYIG